MRGRENRDPNRQVVVRWCVGRGAAWDDTYTEAQETYLVHTRIIG